MKAQLLMCRVWKAFLWWYISTFWHDWSFLMKQHKKFDNLFNCKIHARFNEIFVNIIHSQLARVKKGRWKVLKQCMKGPSRWKMKITWPSCQEKPKNHPSTRFKLFFWKRNDVLQIWITMWVYNLIRWAVFFHMHACLCCNPLKPLSFHFEREQKSMVYIYTYKIYFAKTDDPTFWRPIMRFLSFFDACVP